MTNYYRNIHENVDYNSKATYKIENYKVSLCDSDFIQLQGTTRCGLYFLLLVINNKFFIDGRKLLHFYCSDTLENAAKISPNYTLNLTRNKTINLDLIMEVCKAYCVCNFYNSTPVLEDDKDRRKYNLLVSGVRADVKYDNFINNEEHYKTLNNSYANYKKEELNGGGY